MNTEPSHSNDIYQSLGSECCANKNNSKFPERQLWAAVLHQAIKDAEELYQNYKLNSTLLKYNSFTQEVLILSHYFQNESMEIGGFGFICSHLDIDEECFRNKVMNKYLNPMLNQMTSTLVQQQAEINKIQSIN
jgi:hypothetical protein